MENLDVKNKFSTSENPSLMNIDVSPAVDPPIMMFEAETAKLSPWPRAIDKNPMIRIKAPKQVSGVECPGMWYFRIFPEAS